MARSRPYYVCDASSLNEKLNRVLIDEREQHNIDVIQIRGDRESGLPTISFVYSVVTLSRLTHRRAITFMNGF